ncbi:hypothetical protein BJY00DRAFT_271887 [Aspergillus carlsbadensis]|nr:hypothetical protein BJY00DRAFT_271887 [Aspergillus carlsbadensis]
MTGLLLDFPAFIPSISLSNDRKGDANLLLQFSTSRVFFRIHGNIPTSRCPNSSVSNRIGFKRRLYSCGCSWFILADAVSIMYGCRDLIVHIRGYYRSSLKLFGHSRPFQSGYQSCLSCRRLSGHENPFTLSYTNSDYRW